MIIKVAYDISVLGRCFTNPASRTGLYRVIGEILQELNKKPGIKLTSMGLCDPKVVFGSELSSLYIKYFRNDLQLDFVDAYQSRFGLKNFYHNLIELQYTQDSSKTSKSSGVYKLIRGLLKLASYLQYIDGYNVFDPNCYDVFHSPYFKLPPIALTRNLSRVLTIYDLIPVKYPEFSSRVIDNIFKQILESIDYEKDWIICISDYTKNEFCEYTKMAEERVLVTPLAASCHFYPVQENSVIIETKSRYNIPEGEYFLSLASFQPRKNFAHLITSFFDFVSEYDYKNLYLVIVGEKGWNYEQIYSSANINEKLKSRIIFTGYVPDEDLSSIYSGARGFIFPSLAEGFGLPVLEAMQCGVPVICSNTTSLPEVVADASILIDPTNKDELCQAMLSLMSDSLLGSSLRVKGLQRAKKFSWAKCADETVKVYQKAVNSK